MFRMNLVLLSAASIFVALPTIALADITVNNASNAFATANMDFSPCSSIVGDAGMMKPKTNLTVPKAVTDMYCGIKPCQANVYLSKNCSGKKIAVVTVDKDKGVIDIKNYSADYAFSGSGNSIVLNGRSHGGLFEWLFG